MKRFIYLEWLIDDVKSDVILNILPSSISVTHNPSQKPVVMTPMKSVTSDMYIKRKRFKV